jgi:hypothetical protein
VEPFITKVLMRDGLGGSGVPAELFWDCSDLNSANQRAIFAKGETTFAVLGDGLIGRLCNPAAVRYLIARMDAGKLRRPMRRILTVKEAPGERPEPGETTEPAFFDDADDQFVETWIEDTENHWTAAIDWTRPAKMSIDNGRDAAAELAQLANGVETLATISDRRGRDWRRTVRQWFREFSFAFREAKRSGVPWAIKLWRAGTPGAATADPDKDPADPKDKPEPEPPKK